MGDKPISDLHRLVNLGYGEESCREALLNSRGDYKLALRMVQARALNKDTVMDSSWTKEQDDDWLRNVPTAGSGLATNARTRALGKSPIYVRVASWTRHYKPDGSSYRIMYHVKVTLKDGRQWTVERPWTDFLMMYNSMPFGTFAQFKNPFPLTSLVNSFFTMSDAQLEDRRVQLEAWLLEVCMTESCMGSEAVLGLVYSFIQADAHGGRVGTSSGTSASPAPAQRSGTTSPGPGLTGSSPSPGSSPQRTVDPLRYTYKIIVPVTNITRVPLSVPKLTDSLPCKVNFNATLTVGGAGASTSAATIASLIGVTGGGKDQSDAQLSKDYSRDRVILQGRRFLGSVTGFAGLLEECRNIIGTFAASATSPADGFSMAPAQVDALARDVLQSAGRTESAFRSHAALSTIVDLFPAASSAAASSASASAVDTGDCDGGAMPMPLCIVPESELAKPIEVSFQLKRRPPANPSATAVLASASSSNSASPIPAAAATAAPAVTAATATAQWCLVCDMQAATVFKICDPETMDTAVQLKVTYYHQIMEFPLPTNDTKGGSGRKVATWLHLEKDMMTTRRDWSGENAD